MAVSFESPEYTADTADTVGIGALRVLEAIRIAGLEKKLAIIRLLLQSYMVWCKKFHRKKLHLFTLAHPMRRLSCMLTGLR